MVKGGRSAWQRYGVAVLATIAALVLRILLQPILQNASPFLLFALAVMVSAWYGGLGPGLFATLCGAIAADYYLLQPLGFSHTLDQATRALVFVVVGVQISWLSGALHNAKQRAEREADAARRGEELYRTLAANFPDGIVGLFDRDLRWTLVEGAGLARVGLARGHLDGKHLGEGFPPDTAGLIESICRRALEGNGTIIADEVPHDARIYFVQAVPLTGIAAGAAHAGMAIMQDVTERARARDALRRAHDELEQRVRERTSELHFQKTLLECQTEAARDGIVAVSEAGRIIFSNHRFEELWRNAARDGTGRVEDVRQTMTTMLAEPIISDPLGTAGERRGRSDERGYEEVLLRDGKTLERYSAPIVNDDGTTYGRVWYFRDITERKQLEKEIVEAGERERRRIGQDLHDDLCQQLSGIACLGRVLQRRLESVSKDGAEDAGEIARLVQEATQRARDLARGLQPVNLGTEGLDVALAELCASTEAIFGVRCSFRGEVDIELQEADVAAHLYRIAQEAIHNAVRHGEAAHIALDLVAASGGRLIMTVEDDGKGIPDVLPRQGMGLHTMSFRARLIGGVLSVERGHDGHGTVVICSIRIPSASPQAPAAPAAVEYSSGSN